MSTLRGRLPILLCECIDRGIEITFGHHMHEPVLYWKYPNGAGGHYHLDNLIPGNHGGNMLKIEPILERVLAEYES